MLKQRLITSYLDKFKSSIRNKYCLFCRTEIIDDHYCVQLSNLEDKVIEIYFELNKEEKKEIYDVINDSDFNLLEFIKNIKNKILAYSL